MYLDEILPYSTRGRIQTPFLDFVRDEFRPALYNYKVTREDEGHTIGDDQIGFIANDISDNEIAQTFLYNVGTDDDPDLMFSPTGYTTVIAEALQEEIQIREATIASLENTIINLEERLRALENK
jgi:hypothetical protein